MAARSKGSCPCRKLLLTSPCSAWLQAAQQHSRAVQGILHSSSSTHKKQEHCLLHLPLPLASFCLLLPAVLLTMSAMRGSSGLGSSSSCRRPASRRPMLSAGVQEPWGRGQASTASSSSIMIISRAAGAKATAPTGVLYAGAITCARHLLFTCKQGPWKGCSWFLYCVYGAERGEGVSHPSTAPAPASLLSAARSSCYRQQLQRAYAAASAPTLGGGLRRSKQMRPLLSMFGW
jgi:hypothetical protein